MYHLPASRFPLIKSRSDSSKGRTLAWSKSFETSQVFLNPAHAVKHTARIKIPREVYMNYFEVSPPTIIEVQLLSTYFVHIKLYEVLALIIVHLPLSFDVCWLGKRKGKILKDKSNWQVNECSVMKWPCLWIFDCMKKINCSYI